MTAPIRPVRPTSTWKLSTWLSPAARRTAAALLIAPFLVGGAVGEAAAQSLEDRVKRLQQELQTLQRHVYNSGSGGSGGSAGGAGAAADIGRPQMARMELRFKQMETEMRALTGQLEEVSFRVNQVGQRLDTLVADVDRRLQALEQGGAAAPLGDPLAAGETTGAQTAQLGQGGPNQGAASQGGATQGTAGLPAEGQGTATLGAGLTGQGFDSGPRVLGTVRASDVEALRQRQAQGGAAGQAAAGARPPAPSNGAPQTAALAGATPKEQYDYAFGLLSQANYPEAERALTAFLDSYPADPLAGNAKYWLGETYYVRGQFREAAVTFAEGFQRYPDSPKAPDNLLKLGKSLAALGQSADACGTFAELVTRYPNAPATIQQQAATERQRLSCQ